MVGQAPESGIDPQLYLRITQSTVDCEELSKEAYRFLSKNCTAENISARWAYPPDRRDSATAFCVAIKVPGGPDVAPMPGFPASDIPPLLLSASKEIAALLSLSKGRMMLSMNFYRGISSGIQRHFDGDWLTFSVSGEKLDIRLGVRPIKVAVLTLLNRNSAAGTILFDPHGRSTVVRARPGEVLVFDNLRLEHGATAINETSAESRVCRIVLSWRSIDENCCLVRNNANVPASFEEILECHKQFLNSRT